MLKSTGFGIYCTVSAFVVGSSVLIAYNWPIRIAEITSVPFASVTWALSPLKLTFAPFETSLETNTRFDHRSSVCSASSKVIFFCCPLTIDTKPTVPLPIMPNVEPFPAESLVAATSNRVYDMNIDLSAKQ